MDLEEVQKEKYLQRQIFEQQQKIRETKLREHIEKTHTHADCKMKYKELADKYRDQSKDMKLAQDELAENNIWYDAQEELKKSVTKLTDEKDEMSKQIRKLEKELLKKPIQRQKKECIKQLKQMKKYKQELKISKEM